MDEVEENKFHIYRIPVPQDFVSIDGDRGITIALAYDPPVRGSRKEYMARTMFFQPLIGVTADQAQLMLAKFDGEKKMSRRCRRKRSSTWNRARDGWRIQPCRSEELSGRRERYCLRWQTR